MYDLLIQDATVVDPQGEGVRILPGHDILVRGQQIGRVLMRGRRLRTLDKAMITREVAARVERLKRREHGQRIQTYSGAK